MVVVETNTTVELPSENDVNESIDLINEYQYHLMNANYFCYAILTVTIV
jgi:hypothetical protein